jgi:hypothetical protein
LGGGLWLAAPAAWARTSHCLVINRATTSYTSLQAAQDAAAAGATLWVRGTCTGTTEITKSLTITGQQPAGFTAPTLNGGGQGSVLTIDPAVTVTINTLTITGGSGTLEGGGVAGGGIFNNGIVTLNSSSITGNAVSAGIAGGGGIENSPGAAVTLNDTSVTENTADSGSFAIGNGAGIENAGGTVILNGTSSISGNAARDYGGGIQIFEGGTVTLNDSATVTGNAAGLDGGGVYNASGTATGATATNITANTPDNCAPSGSVPGCTG